MEVIENIVVVGSGVMGAGIAGQIANAGFKVYLLDIIPTNAAVRNILAKQAIAKLVSIYPNNIIPGNIEDDIEALKSADWIIEVIIERLEIKQDLYKKLEQHCQPSCIISSNTSTIPLKSLINERSERFKQYFLITHFFNPPRYMPLLELITSDFTKTEVVKIISDFLDVYLGKTIVKSNDTPGFIANRIGCYWLEVALTTAIEFGVSVEEVDSWLGKPVGVPSTAVFGLYDLIGIDTMQLIVASLKKNLAPEDDFLNISKKNQLVIEMIEHGYTGRKGKGGFYKISKDEAGNKIKEVIDLRTGIYHLSKNTFYSGNLKELIDSNHYVLTVISKTLSYAANLVAEASDSIYDIDQAMKLGYSWKFGPFELIDMLGASYFKQKLEQQNLPVPKILSAAQPFYQQNSYFNGVDYSPIIYPKGIILLKDYKNILVNDSARIFDLGDNIAAIEFTSKMAMADHDVFNLILDFFAHYSGNFKGLILVGGQVNFSVGGNLKFILDMAETKNFHAVDEYLKLGQAVMITLKYSPIPVVSALKGMALGGGSEFLLHSSATVAHIETNSGLVETGIGLIPSWGGCKEMILRSKTNEDLISSFKHILAGSVSSSAYELQSMLQLKNFHIAINSNRVLGDSKNLCLQLDHPITQEMVQSKIEINWEQIIFSLNLKGYDQIIAQELVSIFTSNDLGEAALLDQERAIFIKLLHNSFTQERIKYMLSVGKRLKN